MLGPTYNIEDVLLGRSINKVDLGTVRVTVGSTGGGGDEEGSAEVVSEDADSHGLVEASDTGKLVGTETSLLPYIEVVAVSPLAGSGGAVEGVLLAGHDLAGGEVKVGDTPGIGQRRTAALGPVGAGEEGLEASVGLVDPWLVGHGARSELAEDKSSLHFLFFFQKKIPR